MKDCNISVIVPCFNSEETIETCIKSIFDQTISVFEIICIDDGSTDNTLKLLYFLQDKSPSNINFIILEQSNSGPSSARNNGILKSTGNWIAFLDSDDYWINTKIQLSIQFIDYYPNTKLLSSLNLKASYIKIEFNRLLLKNYFITSSVLVRREIILKNLFDSSQKFSEDYKVWLNIVYCSDAYIVSPQTSFSVDVSKNLVGFYSGRGLSSKLSRMELGELKNFYYLYREKKISFFLCIVVCLYSFFKYLIRVNKVFLNKCLYNKLGLK